MASISISAQVQIPQQKNSQYIWSIIMRFYQSSTLGNGPDARSSCGSQSTESWSYSLPLPQSASPLYLYQFSQYCSQFAEISSYLNSELLKNNELISYRLALLPPQLPPSQNQKENRQNDHQILDENPSQKKESKQRAPIKSKPKEEHTKTKSVKKSKEYDIESEQSYRPQDQYSKEGVNTGVSQSKNIPKNYGKAILNFINKNPDFTVRVLEHLNIDYAEFIDSLKKLRGKLSTISELRSLWTNSENAFAKAYRIFSGEYLRKHSLSYIFNSRVQNFPKHIKYRYKIIQSVERPESFTCMKQF